MKLTIFRDGEFVIKAEVDDYHDIPKILYDAREHWGDGNWEAHLNGVCVYLMTTEWFEAEEIQQEGSDDSNQG